MEYRQGSDDTATRFYIAGELPQGYKSGNERRDGTKFVANDASYYVAAYMPANRINANNSMHHPIGANFLIFKNQHGWHNPVNELPISFERLDS
jgi:formylmethanofuran dehydrogenase subunit C